MSIVLPAHAAGGPLRPLITRPALLGLIVLALSAGAALLPLAHARELQALIASPSALSLIYLELSLRQRPHDLALRLELARKTAQAGLSEHARALLDPLSVQSSAAELLRVEIDRQLLAALEPREKSERARALARLLEDLDRTELAHLTPAQAEWLARVSREVGQPARAAAILDGLARRLLPDFEARIQAADRAHLAAGQPERSAALHAAFAELLEGAAALEHALIALERAQSALGAAEAYAWFVRLRRHLPGEPRLLEAGLRLAEATDARIAIVLARELVRLDPTDPERHRKLMQLALWTGASLRALDEAFWLVRHGGSAADRAGALELARANWDLPLVRRLLEDWPQARRRRWRLRTPRLRSPASEQLPGARPLPRRHLPAREQWSSDCKPATDRPSRAATPAKCAPRSCERLRGVRRLGGLRSHARRRSEQSADSGGVPAELRASLGLYEALGDPRAALAALRAARARAPDRDGSLLQLEVEIELRMGVPEAAAATASEALRRFPSQSRAHRLADLWLALGEPERALSALESLPTPRSVEQWRMIAAVAWELGDRAATQRALQEILQLSAASAWEIERLWVAQRASGDFAAAYATALGGWRLLGSVSSLQRAIESALALGAARRASELLVAAAPRLGEQVFALAELLPLRSRVHLLRRLGRDEQAERLLRDSRRSAVTGAAMPASVPAPRFARLLRAREDTLGMDRLLLTSLAFEVEYGERSHGLHGGARYRQAWPGPGLGESRAVIREVALELGGRLYDTSLGLGASVRHPGALWPHARLSQQWLADSRARLELTLELLGETQESAKLRLFGLRNELALETELPLGHAFYLSGRVAGTSYFTHAFRDLGKGLTIDATLGRSFGLGKVATAALRLVARAAPRAPSGVRPWLPDTSGFVGLGASLGRGALATPPSADRRVVFLLDAAAGWLVPLRSVGWSAELGLGIPVADANRLVIAARSGNVFGAAAGWRFYALQAQYLRSLDR